MPSDVDITIILQNKRWTDALPTYETIVPSIVNETLIIIGRKADNTEASVVLADDAFLQKYNLGFRGKDHPTNVLSFPADKSMPFADQINNLGDILISLETIEREALEQHKSLEDHFKHMLVHGILHLVGYDHQSDDDADKMESLEITILQTFGVSNPYDHKTKVSK
jgi:probable rRNA maturation factor